MSETRCATCRGTGSRLIHLDGGSFIPQRVCDIEEWSVRKWYSDRGYADKQIAPCPTCHGDGWTATRRSN